jgi:hypothetical protein
MGEYGARQEGVWVSMVYVHGYDNDNEYVDGEWLFETHLFIETHLFTCCSWCIFSIAATSSLNCFSRASTSRSLLSRISCSLSTSLA